MEQTKAVDLLILVDATASMGSYLTSLTESLPQIISISALTDCFERIGVLAYRDYCDKELLEWSGWLCSSDADEDKPDIIKFAKQLRPLGGGDYPEATKTGLARAYQLMRSDATTLMLLYTDAAPHLENEQDNGYSNGQLERKALIDSQTYGQEGTVFADWAVAARTLADSQKRAQVVSIMAYNDDAKLYWFLSQITGGIALTLLNSSPRNISEVTVEVLLSWMGVRKEGTDSSTLPARLLVDPGFSALIGTIQKESTLADVLSQEFSTYVEHAVDRSILDQHLPRKAESLPNFTETYKSQAKYRSIVTRELKAIIDRDVVAISLNPVFGSLWRTVCNDRENEYRQELLDLFGRKIGLIQNASERANMEHWLAESYDYTAEVLETIAEVPDSQRFPCVCLDPTLVFTAASEEDEDDAENKQITSFTRDELLEIGRSCDGRILRRLGRVLTRLTFIESPDALPAHIESMSLEDLPRIPLALAQEEFGRKFWRILLHIVVPGTMLAGRPSALLAALTIRLGIAPLIEAAEKEVLAWRDKWCNIEIPETWNTSCLSLLLDADRVYRQRVQKDSSVQHEVEGLLRDEDRALFERLVEYKLLERNLETTLTAQVGWTPQQTTMPVGPVVLCKRCEYPRSVTVMGKDSVCGLCLVDWESDEAKQKAESTRVTKTDDETSNAVWYECGVPACRGQYIVYNVESLNVRPKCHYCRTANVTIGGEVAHGCAPLVECVKCLNRMIWPLEYRPADKLDNWECIACRTGKKTIVDVDITAKQLRSENGQDWLLRNQDQKLREPFNNRSLYYVVSQALPLGDICERLTILPGRKDQSLSLHHRGKLIHNSLDLLEQLYGWVHRRRVQLGTCSLCFSDKRKADIHPACGRSGCQQHICKDCLQGWYALNAPGRIINTGALSCPFCRRAPAAKTLATYGMGIHAVGNLREAVEHHGEWIYAWCAECGFAKQYMERVCARGAPPDVNGWACDDCATMRTGKAMQKVKPCPGCGIPTEKVGGCDHITCQVPDCGAHWCFHCGKKQTEDTIYDHLTAEHGGLYNGMDYEEDEDDEFDE